MRRYGTGIAPVENKITLVENKATFVKIDDDDIPSGWECSFIEEYLLEEDEQKDEKNDENEDDEDWQMSLLGIYVVDV